MINGRAGPFDVVRHDDGRLAVVMAWVDVKGSDGAYHPEVALLISPVAGEAPKRIYLDLSTFQNTFVKLGNLEEICDKQTFLRT